MLTGARQAIRSKHATPLLVVAVVVLLAVAAVGSGTSVSGGASAASTRVFGATRSAGGVMVAAFAAILVIAAALAGAIVYALRPSRPRKKSPDDVEWISEPPPAGRLEKVLVPVLLVLLVAGFVGAAVLMARSSDSGSSNATLAPRSEQPVAGATDGGAVPAPTDAAEADGGRWLQLGLVVGTVVVGAAAFAFVGLPRLRKGKSGAFARERIPQPRDTAMEAVELSLDDLRGERDPRRAIIAAYARMELVFERAGLPRSTHETPTEFLRRVLSGASAPPPAASELTELFQEARFSRHELADAQRDDAIRALQQIRDAMTR